jgi:hypothetical protein
MARPTFFFSHARQDREMPGSYLRKFFDSLHFRVAQAAGHVLSDDDQLGTIDSGIALGADWDTKLSGAIVSDNVLLAVITPVYFERPNCGREVGAFVLRSPNLNIDPEGQLTGVENLFIIRWNEPNYYNTSEKNGRIPRIIRRVNDMLPAPAIASANPLLTAAIQFYQIYGMELCVDHEPDYKLLLNALALAIVNAKELPTSSPTNWNQAIDAFRYDWAKHFNTQSAPPGGGAATALFPLVSIAMFYVTDRPYAVSMTSVSYADVLLAEPLADQWPAGMDPAMGELLIDMRNAAHAESFQIVHCAPNPPVPVDANPLIDRLSALSRRNILTALVIDPETLREDIRPVLREVADSPAWNGPILLTSFPGSPAFDPEGILDPPRRVVYTLPEDRNARKMMTTSILLNLRREVRRDARTVRPVAAQPMPRLQNTGGALR